MAPLQPPVGGCCGCFAHFSAYIMVRAAWTVSRLQDGSDTHLSRGSKTAASTCRITADQVFIQSEICYFSSFASLKFSAGHNLQACTCTTHMHLHVRWVPDCWTGPKSNSEGTARLLDCVLMLKGKIGMQPCCGVQQRRVLRLNLWMQQVPANSCSSHTSQTNVFKSNSHSLVFYIF